MAAGSQQDAQAQNGEERISLIGDACYASIVPVEAVPPMEHGEYSEATLKAERAFLRRFDDLRRAEINEAEFARLKDMHRRQLNHRSSTVLDDAGELDWQGGRWDFAVTDEYEFAYVVKQDGPKHFVQKTDWLDPTVYGAFGQQEKSGDTLHTRAMRTGEFIRQWSADRISIADMHYDIALSEHFADVNWRAAYSDRALAGLIAKCADPGVVIARGNMCFMSRDRPDDKGERLWVVIKGSTLLDSDARLGVAVREGKFEDVLDQYRVMPLRSPREAGGRGR
jgi:hypothetical protein